MLFKTLKLFGTFVMVSLVFCTIPFGIAKISNYDKTVTCYETGACQEGLTLKVKNNEEFVVNKNTCIEHKGKWREEHKECLFKIKSTWKF